MTDTSRQGWDHAEFRCGRCSTTVCANTEAEYLARVQQHRIECAANDRRSSQVPSE